MQGPDFIFFLQSKDNKFWNVTSSGNVVLNSNPYPLQFSPAGWDEISIKNVRNKKYWAVDRSVSLSFKYVEDAAKILKHVFYKKGAEENIYLTICEQKLRYNAGVDYGYWYKQVFKSEVDLSTFDHTGPYVSCSTAEEGLAKHLKANENTVYEFPLDVTDAINVKMDGIVLKMKQNWITQTGGLANDRLIGMFRTNKEGNGTGAAFFDISAQSEPADLTTSIEYFYTATKAVTGVRLYGSFKYISSVGNFDIRLKSSAGQNIVVASRSGTDNTLTIDQTFNAAAGEKFFFVFDGVFGAVAFVEETTISISFESRYDTTYVKALRPQYLLNELVNKMTDGEYTADTCPYFGSLQHFDKVFTSGDGIRGLADAKLKISFAQFFEFWDCFDAVGIRELTKKVLLDRKKELTDSVNVISLGEISRPSIKMDKTFPFNELAIGYPDVKNEDGFVNGKNEVNTTFNFSLGTVKSPRKMDRVSKVKASCYDIENTRIEGANRDSTDNRSDNDAYVVHVVDSLTAGSGSIPDHYALDRTYNSFVTGIDQAASVFNLELSPKNNMIRSFDYLHSCFFKCDNRKLKFVSADRNTEMAYLNGSDVRIEKDDVPIGSMDAEFFHPVLIGFETDAPIDLLDLLDANPLQCFEFTFEGNTYKGIPVETGINPKTYKKQTYQLLSHPDNDLSKLIDYYG